MIQKGIFTTIGIIVGIITMFSGWFMFATREANAEVLHKHDTRIERLERIVGDIPVIKNDIGYIKEFIKELRK